MAAAGVTFRREVSITTIAVIVGFAVQIAGGVWFMANLNGQVDLNNKRIEKLELAMEKQRDGDNDFSVRMVRVETQLNTISSQTVQQGQMLREILSELKSK